MLCNMSVLERRFKKKHCWFLFTDPYSGFVIVYAIACTSCVCTISALIVQQDLLTWFHASRYVRPWRSLSELGVIWYCGVYTHAGKSISQWYLILTFLWILKGVSSGDEFIHLLSCFLVNKEDGKRRIMKPVMEVVTTVAYPRIKWINLFLSWLH
jgi:hypothetical protein